MAVKLKRLQPLITFTIHLIHHSQISATLVETTAMVGWSVTFILHKI
jgi:hypothetical protein